jgi:hypothetical protein
MLPVGTKSFDFCAAQEDIFAAFKFVAYLAYFWYRVFLQTKYRYLYRVWKFEFNLTLTFNFKQTSWLLHFVRGRRGLCVGISFPVSVDLCRFTLTYAVSRWPMPFHVDLCRFTLTYAISRWHMPFHVDLCRFPNPGSNIAAMLVSRYQYTVLVR